jgi:hypothetical protein
MLFARLPVYPFGIRKRVGSESKNEEDLFFIEVFRRVFRLSLPTEGDGLNFPCLLSLILKPQAPED